MFAIVDVIAVRAMVNAHWIRYIEFSARRLLSSVSVSASSVLHISCGKERGTGENLGISKNLAKASLVWNHEVILSAL